MHIVIQNFGAIKHAEFDFNDLTIIVGWNNMGKTYAAYAFYGFLYYWRYGYEIKFPAEYYKTFVNKKYLEIRIDSFLGDNLKDILMDASKSFSKPENLAEVFGTQESFFKGASFEIQVDKLIEPREQTCRAKWRDKECIQAQIKNGILIVNLHDVAQSEMPPDYIIHDMLGDCIKKCIFGNLFPRNRIVCAERTGAVIFQKELDFTKNRIIELLGKEESSKLSPIKFLNSFSSRYPLPIRHNVDTIRAFSADSKKSFLFEKQDAKKKKVMDLFAEILNGKYKATKDGIKFIPNKSKNTKLDMILSSSSVRSLLHLAIYLFFEAREGDLLIIDEPEQNLHPSNQRKMARLLAALTQLGVRVLITTHSDYIVKEINTLIMMNNASQNILKLLEDNFGYNSEEKVLPQNVNLYYANWGNIKIPGKKTVQGISFKKAEIDDLGISAVPFDQEIDQMNQIQEYLFFKDESEEYDDQK